MANYWLPPGVNNLILQYFKRSSKFNGPYSTWENAILKSSGYDSDLIVQEVLNSALKVKSGEAKYERDAMTFHHVEYEWPTLTAILWAAAKNNGNLITLDFGGSLGSIYFQNIDFLKNIPNLRWNIVEQSQFVEAGRSHFESEQLRFYKSIEECLVKGRPNLIILSSVLQYLQNPKVILDSLLEIAAETIIVDRTIVNSSQHDKLYIQKVPKKYYAASYPCWSLSEKNLINTFQGSYTLVKDYLSLSFPTLTSIKSEFKGYIFARKSS